MPENYRRVDIGGFSFLIDESADLPFRRADESKMVPRREISGDIGKENLNSTEWPWSLSRFEGGEGRLVLDSSDPGPPHYRSTTGAIDTRISGEFKMAPVVRLKSNASGASINTTQGASFTKLTGNEVVTSTSTLECDAVGEGGYTDRVPGAGETSVAVRWGNVRFNASGGATFRLRVIENPAGAATVVVNQTVSINTLQSGTGPLAFTISGVFTAAAATTYRYETKVDTQSASGIFRVARIAYLDEETGASPVDDSRLLQTGYAGKVWLVEDDATNSDVFVWNMANSEWTLVHGNINTSDPVGAANSDKYQYIGFTNQFIYRFTDTASSGTQYTSDPSKGSLVGVAVGNARLYGLFTQALMEYSLDQTAGLPLAGTQRAGSDVFPTVETADTTLRQQICGTDNGVRWFVNMRGEQAGIYEFSDGAARQVGKLPRGYKATAIFHYAGVTWIGALYSVAAASPATQRAAIYYIDQQGQTQFLTDFRKHNPDDEPVSFIDAHGHDIFFLQGNNAWRYDGTSGGLVLDRITGSADDTKARGLAVQDVKLWAAYQGQGVFVSENAYPVNEEVWLESPVWDFDVPNNDKTFLAFEVASAPLPANTTIGVEYQLDRTGTWISAGTATTDDATSHVFPLYGSVSSPTTIKGRYIQWRAGLSSSDGVSTPVVHAVTLRAYVLEYEPYFEMTVRLEDEDSSLRGPKQLSGPKMAANLKTLVDNKNIVSFVDRYSDPTPGSKTTHAVIIEDPHRDLSRPGQGSARLRLKIVA